MISIINNNIKWKYEIGEHVCNRYNDITILDRELRIRTVNCKGKEINENRKYYQYLCNKCEYDKSWKEESKIANKGCPVCAGHLAAKGINTVGDKRPDLLVYFQNKEDAFKHTIGSNSYVDLICPTCNTPKQMTPHTLCRQGFSCNKCGDGYSYPEKFMMSFLKQAEIDFQYQLSKKCFNWCDKYKYDFYIKDKKCIIEVHGEQHYKKSFSMSEKSVKDIKNIDILKKNLALQNGIKLYFEIDCSKSDMEYIKNSIIESNICEILNININKINFIECDFDACKNLLKDVCEFYNVYDTLTPPEISKFFHLERRTILGYLKRGAKLGICNYDVEKAKLNAHVKAGEAIIQKKSRKIVAYNQQRDIIGIFQNSRLASEYIDRHYNTKINPSNIYAVCTKSYKHAKNFYFEFENTG